MVANISEYLLVSGMYEIKKQNEFTPYNLSINPNLTTWKDYPINIRQNQNNISEIVIDLNDTVI